MAALHTQRGRRHIVAQETRMCVLPTTHLCKLRSQPHIPHTEVGIRRRIQRGYPNVFKTNKAPREFPDRGVHPSFEARKGDRGDGRGAREGPVWVGCRLSPGPRAEPPSVPPGPAHPALNPHLSHVHMGPTLQGSPAAKTPHPALMLNCHGLGPGFPMSHPSYQSRGGFLCMSFTVGLCS